MAPTALVPVRSAADGWVIQCTSRTPVALAGCDVYLHAHPTYYPAPAATTTCHSYIGHGICFGERKAKSWGVQVEETPEAPKKVERAQEEDEAPKPRAPRANPFGSARPREVVLASQSPVPADKATEG